MKTITKYLVATLLILLPMWVIRGQDTAEATLPDNFAGTLTMDVLSANYADGVLTVDGLPEKANWIATTPTIDGGSYVVPNLIADWQVNNLSADAILALSDMTVIARLTVADYDSITNTAKFNVEVVNIYTVEPVKGGAKLPAQFTDAKMLVSVSNEFALSLLDGFTKRVDSTRSVLACVPFVTCKP